MKYLSIWWIFEKVQGNNFLLHGLVRANEVHKDFAMTDLYLQYIEIKTSDVQESQLSVLCIPGGLFMIL
jgi:hypothetical protein